jgi:hypothetical protein
MASSSLVKLLYKNWGWDLPWTASTQEPTLPSTNLGLKQRQRVWRSTAVTGDGAGAMATLASSAAVPHAD